MHGEGEPGDEARLLSGYILASFPGSPSSARTILHATFDLAEKSGGGAGLVSDVSGGQTYAGAPGGLRLTQSTRTVWAERRSELRRASSPLWEARKVGRRLQPAIHVFRHG